jgi:HD-GYP domain-containing protein (c-di-GMP phosphodiesterase class II)
VTYAELTARYERDTLTTRLDELADLVRDLLRDILSQPDAVVHLLDLRGISSYEPQHALQVMVLSLLTGRRLGLEETDLYTLGLAAFLHDLGKVALPQAILDKPGPLSAPEWVSMRRHPVFSAEVLDDHEGLWSRAAILALHHHERLDGSGYPDGLSGDALPRETRILAVADAYDGMTSARPYRPLPIPPFRALRILREEERGRVDPLVVEAMASVVAPYPVGTWLRLSTGQIGLVTEVKPQTPAKPVITVVRHARTGPLPVPIRIDLSLAESEAGEIAAVLEEEPQVVEGEEGIEGIRV